MLGWVGLGSLHIWCSLVSWIFPTHNISDISQTPYVRVRYFVLASPCHAVFCLARCAKNIFRTFGRNHTPSCLLPNNSIAVHGLGGDLGVVGYIPERSVDHSLRLWLFTARSKKTRPSRATHFLTKNKTEWWGKGILDPKSSFLSLLFWRDP